jgi:hypothetical protein
MLQELTEKKVRAKLEEEMGQSLKDYKPFLKKYVSPVLPKVLGVKNLNPWLRHELLDD